MEATPTHSEPFGFTYCDRDHPGNDAEAQAWCASYHRDWRKP